jgi:hypothetical protein
MATPKKDPALKKPTGVPESIKLRETDFKKIRTLAFNGLKMIHIIQYFGVNEETWRDTLERHPDWKRKVEWAVGHGRTEGLELATGKLMSAVQKGNLKAIIFYLKSRGSFNENHINAEFGDSTQQRSVLVINTVDPIQASKDYQKIMQES